MIRHNTALHTLIPLDDFLSVTGLDDRDEKLCRFCLLTSTLTIERHCKRRLLRKKITERVVFHGDLTVPLAEYPVTNINSVHATGNGGELRLDPRYYSVTPDCGIDYDIPFTLSISSFVKRLRGVSAFRVDYRAGYTLATVPADLGAACLELASWNFGRYRGRRVGMTGSVAGNWKDREHFEMSLPENVRALLEPFVRRTL